ncbi:MAG: DUF547 domain-containing protein [Acidobacteriota bacterium]
MRTKPLRLLLMIASLLAALSTPFAASAALDHMHPAWDALLRRHVVLVEGGNASRVSYSGLQKERATLQKYLAALTGVTRAEYDGWTKPQQLAFLINAYNAFTVDLILGKYPDLQSIKDLGSVFTSPWKKSFFHLLGEPMSLDGIEHDTIRKRGSFVSVPKSPY